jgi:serine/threonine protein kinase
MRFFETGTFGCVLKDVGLEEVGCVFASNLLPLPTEVTEGGPCVLKLFRHYSEDDKDDLEEVEAEMEAASNFRVRDAVGKEAYCRLFAELMPPGVLTAHDAFVTALKKAEPSVVNKLRWCVSPMPRKLLVYRDAGVDLLTVLKNKDCTLDTAVAIMSRMRDVFEAVQLLHSVNEHHWDIKPCNILAQTGPGGAINLRLIDFGMAGPEKQEKMMKHPLQYMYWPMDLYYARGVAYKTPNDMWRDIAEDLLCDVMKVVPEFCAGGRDRSYYAEFAAKYPAQVTTDATSLVCGMDIFMLGVTLVQLCFTIKKRWDVVGHEVLSTLERIQRVAARMADYDVTVRTPSMAQAKKEFEEAWS